MSGFTRNSVCLILALLLLVATSLAAQELDPTADRSSSKLGPGVLTVIPSIPEEAETYSRLTLAQLRRDFAFKNWTPEYGAPTRTLYDRAIKAQLRRPIWGLEFTFKPFRLVHVDVPQPNGKMQRKPIWYMVYRVRYLGEELHPQPDETVVEQSKFTKYLPDRRDVDSRRFVPQFVLRDHNKGVDFLDRVIPAALDEIQDRERIKALYNTVEMAGVSITLSGKEPGAGVWGVVTWEDIDPRCDFFSVYVQGLTNAYRFQADPTGMRRGSLQYKTLQLNFYRPGDSVLEHEDEFRYGIPDNPTQRRLTHVIERGDSLVGLARRYLGDPTRADEIYQANRNVLAAPDKLPEGVLILIPTVDFADLEPASDVATELYSIRQRQLFAIYGVNEQVKSLWVYRPGTLAQPPAAQ